ncbi:MAG: hypothetical protein GYB31_15660 [Bacteroidetes bacterium]|nr:hypothetical protein [Bacteroidota bacterium]
MKKNSWIRWCSLVLLIGSLPFCALAQDSAETDTIPNSEVLVDYSDIFEYILEDGEVIQKMLGNVELRQDSVYMYCDSATILNEMDVIATGNVIIQQGDSISVFADSLFYNGADKIADLYGNVVLVNGNNKLFTETLNYDLNTKTATYHDGALLTDDTTQLRSKHGYYFVGEDMAFFKDSVVVVDPEFELKSDTLQYQTREKVVTFLGPTLITQNDARIFCESGNYFLGTSTAVFRGNAQYRTEETLAEADVIRYEGDSKTVYLDGNAVFEEDGKTAKADLIRYDEANDVAYLEGNASYIDEEQNIAADSITYDRANDLYATRGRGVISNPPQILEADLVDYDKTTGLGIATGNVIWRDTSAALTIICNQANYDESSNYLKATGGRNGRPLLISEVEGDSLFMSADTLVSLEIIGAMKEEILPDSTKVEPQGDSLTTDSIGIIPAEDILTDTTLQLIDTTLAISDSLLAKPTGPDTTRLLLAYNNVRLYKSNIQAVCDSLTYNTTDSLFQFFQEPVVWSDTSQFSADTIRMQMANDEIDRIFLNQDAFILNSPDEIYYNQIKGRDMIAYFDSSELRRMRVEGNAESVYYGLDSENAYLGVNKTLCSEMLLYFGNNQVKSITFYAQPKGDFIPMRKADHEGLKMDGFNWQAERRPGSREDIY